jgi:hypothetical protein
MTNSDNYIQFSKIKQEITSQKIFFINVVSDSMSPLVKINDKLIVTPVDLSKLRRFDVILFWYRGAPTMHFYWGENTLTEKGTIMTKSLKSPVEIDDPIPKDKVLGIVKIRMPLWAKLLFLFRYIIQTR